MANLSEKNKPYPENRSPEDRQPEKTPTGPKRIRRSLWNIVLLIALLGLLVWIFAFVD